MAYPTTEQQVRDKVWSVDSGTKLKYLQVVTTGHDTRSGPDQAVDPAEAVLNPVANSTEEVLFFDLNDIAGTKPHSFLDTTIHTGLTDLNNNEQYAIKVDSSGNLSLAPVTSPPQGRITDVKVATIYLSDLSLGSNAEVSEIASAVSGWFSDENTLTHFPSDPLDEGDVVIVTVQDAGVGYKEARILRIDTTNQHKWEILSTTDVNAIGVPGGGGTIYLYGPSVNLTDYFAKKEDVLPPDDQYWRPINRTADGEEEFDDKIFFPGIGAALCNQPDIARQLIGESSNSPKFLIRGGSGTVGEIRIYKSDSTWQKAPTDPDNATDPCETRPTSWLDIGYFSSSTQNPVWGFKATSPDDVGASLLHNDNGLYYTKPATPDVPGLVQFNATSSQLTYSLSDDSRFANFSVSPYQIVLKSENGGDEASLYVSPTTFSLVSRLDGHEETAVRANSTNIGLCVKNTVTIDSAFLQLPKLSSTDVSERLYTGTVSDTDTVDMWLTVNQNVSQATTNTDLLNKSVFLAHQNDASQNGLYLVDSSGNWTKTSSVAANTRVTHDDPWHFAVYSNSTWLIDPVIPQEGLMYVSEDSTYGSTLKIYLNGGWRTMVVQ